MRNKQRYPYDWFPNIDWLNSIDDLAYGHIPLSWINDIISETRKNSRMYIIYKEAARLKEISILETFSTKKLNDILLRNYEIEGNQDSETACRIRAILESRNKSSIN
jgi:GR25 family glycosyltransferase involved in LPS biosynthesis